MKKSLLITLLVLTTTNFAFASNVIEDAVEDLFSPLSALADCLNGRNGTCRESKSIKVASIQFVCKERLAKDRIHLDIENNTAYYADTVKYEVQAVLFNKEGFAIRNAEVTLWEKSATGRNYDAKDTSYTREEINVAINIISAKCEEKVSEYKLKMNNLMKQ